MTDLYVRFKFQKVPEGSQMFTNVHNCSQRFQKVPEGFLEPEGSGKAQGRFREGSGKVHGRFRKGSWEV